MTASSRPAYDEIGRAYARTRKTDPRLAERIWAALGDAASIANVGAGPGSYEPRHRSVIAFEPSPTMAAQRPHELDPAILASAESLPLIDGAVDAAMAILSVHHWSDAERGVAEMRRVARGPVVIVTFEPKSVLAWWIRDYAPQIHQDDVDRFPDIADLAGWLSGARVEQVPIARECEDLFLGALWARPELMLDPEVRAGTSGFARLDSAAEHDVVHQLRADLDSGEWDRRYGHLRELEEFDVGVRLVCSS